jgi:hypothetical protein
MNHVTEKNNLLKTERFNVSADDIEKCKNNECHVYDEDDSDNLSEFMEFKDFKEFDFDKDDDEDDELDSALDFNFDFDIIFSPENNSEIIQLTEIKSKIITLTGKKNETNFL